MCLSLFVLYIFIKFFNCLCKYRNVFEIYHPTGYIFEKLNSYILYLGYKYLVMLFSFFRNQSRATWYQSDIILPIKTLSGCDLQHVDRFVNKFPNVLNFRVGTLVYSLVLRFSLPLATLHLILTFIRLIHLPEHVRHTKRTLLLSTIVFRISQIILLAHRVASVPTRFARTQFSQP